MINGKKLMSHNGKVGTEMKKRAYRITDSVKIQVRGKNWDDDYIANAIIIGINPDYVLNGKTVYIVKLEHDEKTTFNITEDEFIK